MSTFKKTVTIEGFAAYANKTFARVSQETLDVSEDTLSILREFCKEPMEVERLIEEAESSGFVQLDFHEYLVETGLEGLLDLFPTTNWGTLVGPFKITINENLLEN